MTELPYYLSITFILITLITLVFLYFASHKSSFVLILCMVWLSLQAILGKNEFYLTTDTFPPRFLALLLPPILSIILLFSLKKGRLFLDKMNLQILTLLHIVRIPVEIVLFGLYTHELVPKLMTFEGINFDIISGITSPIIFYFGYYRKRLNPKIILLWNFLCIGLLLNIVIHAILSTPFPFQQLAFEQPNIAVLYFPFNWLPAFVVPVVLFAHLVCIRQLMKKP